MRSVTASFVLSFVFLAGAEAVAHPGEVRVRNHEQLRQAAAEAGPGSRILIEPGEYRGGFHLPGLRGEPDRPILIMAADPENPPVIIGGGNGMHLPNPAFVELRHLVLVGGLHNGLNIDDGGSFEATAHHIRLRNIIVRNVGPDGNRDGIKLSGVTDFVVENCVVENWGTGGSAIDMVGCHRGLIHKNHFRHAASAHNAIQTKGGTSEIVIRLNRFHHAGQRAVQIGGSTGLTLFRPPLGDPPHAEARDILVERNHFLGGDAPVAFVNVDGAMFRFNTIYRPNRWVLRILQETQSGGFVPSRGGVFANNIVVFDSRHWAGGGVNVGPHTAPETFEFRDNWWFCLDQPGRTRALLELPVPETGGVYGLDPLLRDPENGDLRLRPASPAQGVFPR